MTVLAPWLGTETPRAELEQLARRALDAGKALIDLARVDDADFAARIRQECERQWGRVR